MSDKLTDNDIKKALGDCITHNDSCISCPSNKFCYEHDSKLLMKATLDLINRQDEEIERLNKEAEKGLYRPRGRFRGSRQ